MKFDNHFLRRLFLAGHDDPVRVMGDFAMNNGIAHMVCNITGIDQVVSNFSVPGYEVLQSEFADYLDRLTECIPDNCPVLLEITGTVLTSTEKARIEQAIRNRYALKLARLRTQRRATVARSIWFAIFASLSLFGVLYSRDTQQVVANELIYVIFYAFGDRMLQSFFLDGRDMRGIRLQLARMKNMKLCFSEHYTDRELTNEEAAEIRQDIARMATAYLHR